MADFGAPEYASYIKLCRELKLDHKWQAGDQFGYEGEHNQTGVALQGISVRGFRDWWLPTLADWLEMLEEAGHRDIGFWREQNWTAGLLPAFQAHGVGPAREEAAARLWVAVKSDALRQAEPE